MAAGFVAHLASATPAPAAGAGISPAAAGSAARGAAVDAGATANPNVRVQPVALQQARVEALERELNPPQERTGGGFLGGARRAAQSTLGVGGNPAESGTRQRAAETLLEEQATKLAHASGVIVVIGGSEDLEKVRASLVKVAESVVVLHADPAVEGNDSLEAGGEGLVGAVVGRVAGRTQNVWVYRTGEESPTKLPVASVTDATWAPFFEIDLL